MTPPRDPIAAVTHADPYPYYARLAEAPLHRDERLGLWIAAGAAAAAVLASPRCAVRPADEPVPRALVDTPAGALFARLLRQRDGARHRAARAPVTAAIAALEARVGEASTTVARDLAADLAADFASDLVDSFVRALPTAVVAHLLGIPADARIPGWIDDLARGFAPAAPAAAIQRAIAAAGELTTRIGALDLPLRGLDRDDAIANTIGLLLQAHDATAGLLGNILVALGRGAADDDLAARVLQRDPPAHNTRRFVVDADTIAGQPLARGDAILVVLIGRPLGDGPHACPGAALATSIATAGVRALRAAGVVPAELLPRLRYRPLPNTRIPVFAEAA